jgi:hypothetical protein
MTLVNTATKPIWISAGNIDFGYGMYFTRTAAREKKGLNWFALTSGAGEVYDMLKALPVGSVVKLIVPNGTGSVLKRYKYTGTVKAIKGDEKNLILSFKASKTVIFRFV